MKIVTWQNVLTDHQVFTLRELQECAGHPIKIIVGVEQLDARIKQGWKKPNTDGLSVCTLARGGGIIRGFRLLRENADAIHLFVGLWSDRRFIVFILYALLRGIRVGLITEAYSYTPLGIYAEQAKWLGILKALLRPAMYRIMGLLIGSRIKPVFTISSRAKQQFKKAGFSDQYLFPFAYCVPRLESGRPEFAIDSKLPISIVFVGALIHVKGIDEAISATQWCLDHGMDIELDLYGPGEISAWREKLNERIRYRGVIPFGQAQNVIKNYDLLVLPSRYDGWGVVVNEALLQSVPVLVSSGAGSSDLVRGSGAGAVFSVGDYKELVQLIKDISINLDKLSQWKSNAKRIGTLLSPKIAGRYMIKCIDAVESGAPKPECPWY